jgi:flagellar hook-length control protein FliK
MHDASDAQAIPGTSGPTSAQDTFAALDQQTSWSVPTWTHAAGQHAEAGFRDPELGWVGVRADLSASGVHATVVPSSADAAQALGSHLAGLNSHLAEQHAAIATLSMASPGESGAGGGIAQHTQQGTEGNDRGSNPQESAASSRANSTGESNAAAATIKADTGASFEARAYAGDLRGRFISVVA